MRLAPKNRLLRVLTYSAGGVAVGAALIALLPTDNPGTGDQRSETIASEQVSTTSSQSVTTSSTGTSSNPANTSTSGERDGTAAGAESGSATTSEAEPEPTVDPAQRPMPTTASEMAAELTAAELAVRDETATNSELDAWGRRQQALYRHLGFNSDWADEALAGVDPLVADAAALNWNARLSLSSLVNTEKLHDELPAWRVNPPLPPAQLIEYYKAAEAESGIQWEFLAAINLIETRMGRIEGVSTAGAVGPMQFLPTTWAECCEGDPTDPADAIPGAARYLTIRGGPENMERAIWGYNNSDYYVEAVTSYATVMMENERAYYGYHAWEIYFLSTEGLIRIPVGYEQLEPIAATAWLADNPETLFTP
jgi:hypothetical protein